MAKFNDPLTKLWASLFATILIIALFLVTGVFLLLSTFYGLHVFGIGTLVIYALVAIGGLVLLNWGEYKSSNSNGSNTNLHMSSGGDSLAASSFSSNSRKSPNAAESLEAIHDWISSASGNNIASNNQLMSRYESIEKIHPGRRVRSQILRLEDLLLDLYIKPWFFFITNPIVNQHARNPRPLFTQMEHLSPPILQSYEEALVNGLLVKKNSIFIFTLRYYLRFVLIELRKRVEKVDWTNVILEVLVPLITQHIHDYKKAVQEISQRGNRNLTASEELDLYTASLFRQGRLHVALGGSSSHATQKSRTSKIQNLNGLPINTTEFEQDYLRCQMDDILPKILPDKSVFLHCLLREIIVVYVLQPVLSLLAEPDFWNQKIDLFATRAIKEQKMVTKLREALDKPFSEQQEIPKLKIPSKMPSFDKYLETIKECRNLLDAKRIHHSIMTEIQRKKNLIGSRTDKDIVNGRRVLDLRKYINRLKIAQKKVEKKIIELGGTVSVDSHSSDHGKNSSPYRSPVSDFSLIDYSDVINLLHEPALSYFREYLEKIREIDILQLYCSVQALNVHLAEKSGRQSHGSALMNLVDFEGRKTLRNDIITIYSTYLIKGGYENPIVKKLDLIFSDVQDLYSHIESLKIASEESISAALEYLKAVQMKARNYLQMFSLSFQHSDTYYRLLSDPARFTFRKETSPIQAALRRERTINSRSTSNNSNAADQKLFVDTSSIHRHGDDSSSEPSPPNEYQMQTSPPITITRPQENSNEVVELFAPTPLFPFSSPPHSGKLVSAEEKPSTASSTESYLDPVQMVQMEIESIFGHESQGEDNDDDDLELTDDEIEANPEFIDSDEHSDTDQQDSKETPKSKATAESKTHKELAEKYKIELKRIDADLSKIRQQKTLLQYMGDNQPMSEGKNHQREQKLLRKMQFQFEQEEKLLESERKQLQWKMEGTLIMPGLTKITIPSFEMVESPVKSSKKPFVVYFIEIVQHKNTSDDSAHHGWMMVRRYSEFHALHRHLKEAYPEIMLKSKFNFPGKRFLTAGRVKTALFSSQTTPNEDLTVLFQSAKDLEFIEQRRKGLETYLNAICSEPVVAGSWVFRQFLCEDKNYSFSIKGFRDLLPKKSSIVSIFSGLSSRFGKNEGKIGAHVPNTQVKHNNHVDMAESDVDYCDETDIHDIWNHLSDEEATVAVDNDGIFEFSQNKGAESLSSLLLELFDLNEKSNWWRRQAITWVMQQFLGGTFERKISEFLADSTNEERMTFYLTSLNDMMESWKSNPQPIIRTQTEKTRSRLSVYKKLHLLIPDMAGSIVGKSNAKRGSNRLFDLLQNRRLNQDLVYRALDIVLKKIMAM